MATAQVPAGTADGPVGTTADAHGTAAAAHADVSPPPPGDQLVAPAGRALQVMLVALLLAVVFNSAAMVKAGEGMRPGLTRTLVLGVAHPVNAVSHGLWLDRPRREVGRLFGHGSGADSSPLLAEPAGAGAAPSPSPTAATTRSPAPPAPAMPLARAVTAAAPLQLVVAGDSMTEFLGPAMISATSAADRIKGRVDTRYGTGLVRPDFFDWFAEAKRVMGGRRPEAVVVMMGGNDGQGILLPSGKALRDGSAAWTTEYQRRTRIIMDTLVKGGARRVYWVSMPVPRSARLARDYRQLNVALAAAARTEPGVRYVDITTRLSVRGRYSDYLRNDAGRTVVARARDGIHMSRDGARMAANVVLKALDADWHVLS